MDTIILLILALLFIIIIFLSLQPSNNIKTKQEDYRPPATTAANGDRCIRDELCCPIQNLTDCKDKKFMNYSTDTDIK